MATFRIVPTYNNNLYDNENLLEKLGQVIKLAKADFEKAKIGEQTPGASKPAGPLKLSPPLDERIVSFDAGNLRDSLGKGTLHIDLKSGVAYMSLDEHTAISKQGRKKPTPKALQEFEAGDERAHHLLRAALLVEAGYQVDTDTESACRWLESVRAAARLVRDKEVEEYIRYAKKRLKDNSSWYWKPYRAYTEEFVLALTSVTRGVGMVPLKEDVRNAFRVILEARDTMDEFAINDAFAKVIKFTGFLWLPNSPEEYPSEVLAADSEFYQKALAKEGVQLWNDISG